MAEYIHEVCAADRKQQHLVGRLIRVEPVLPREGDLCLVQFDGATVPFLTRLEHLNDRRRDPTGEEPLTTFEGITIPTDQIFQLHRVIQ